jgi:hypothetical protein
MNPYQMGTEMGLYTVAELSDLLKAKDEEMHAMDTAYNAYAPNWHGPDADNFANDWHALQARYASARTAATNTIANASSWIPANMNPADGDYHAVINSLIQVEGTTTKGDLQDLYNRLSAAQKKPVEGPDFKVSQPTKGSDADENALKGADAFMNHLNKAKPAIALGIAGIATSALASFLPIPLLGLAGVGAFGAGVYWTMKDFGIVK